MFTAHLDCIYPGNEAPVKPIFYRSGDIGTNVRNSLGADDKSGIAGILATLEYIVKGRLPHGEIKTVFTIQEEIGWRGIKQIPGSILNGIQMTCSKHNCGPI
jgi:tripeptide aminopeptidase